MTVHGRPPKILITLKLRRYSHGTCYKNMGEVSLTLDGRRISFADVVQRICKLFGAPVPPYVRSKALALDEQREEIATAAASVNKSRAREDRDKLVDMLTKREVVSRRSKERRWTNKWRGKKRTTGSGSPS